MESASRSGIDRGAEPRRERGLTIVELLAVVVILMMVAAAALPVAVNSSRRAKELDLHRALTTMRRAIDEYHKYAAAGMIQPWDPDWEMYPRDLQMLIEGIEVTDPRKPVPKTIQFLKEIPVDPITGQREWGFRSYQDEPDDRSWGEENLFDVYSLSAGTALDGTPYSEFYGAEDCALTH